MADIVCPFQIWFPLYFVCCAALQSIQNNADSSQMKINNSVGPALFLYVYCMDNSEECSLITLVYDTMYH